MEFKTAAQLVNQCQHGQLGTPRVSEKCEGCQKFSSDSESLEDLCQAAGQLAHLIHLTCFGVDRCEIKRSHGGVLVASQGKQGVTTVP